MPDPAPESSSPLEPRTDASPEPLGLAEVPAERRLGPSAAQLLAYLSLGLVNALWIAVLPLPPGGLVVRADHHFFDAGHWWALGLTAALAAAVPAWFGLRHRAVRWVLLAALGAGVALGVLRPDLDGLTERLTRGPWAPTVQSLLAVAGGLSLVVSGWVGTRLARPWLRWLPIVGALGLAVAQQFILTQGYPGGHFLLALNAATLGATAAAGTHLPTRRSAPPDSRMRRLWSRWRVRMLLTIGLIWATASVAVRPSNPALLELFRLDGSVVAWQLGRLRPSRTTGQGTIPAALRPWVTPRRASTPVAPSKPPLLPPDGIVLMVTIDSLRADLLADETNRAQFPNLFSLRDASVYFPKARSPGSGTRIALGAVFTGRYFSQLQWNDPQGTRPKLDRDKSPRFPERLRAAGVRTVTYASEREALVRAVGIVRGFQEEHVIKPVKGQPYALSDAMVDRAIDTLDRHTEGPLFLFMHLMDAHVPYDAVLKTGTPRERWRAELRLVDTQMGRLLAHLDAKGLTSRTAVIVSADHGEALGEHNTPTHNATLYEELIRVPLFIRVPGAKARQVANWVQLTDLGPTILDLMGVNTPGSNMGTSLLPYVRGQNPKYTRPIVSERRFGYAVVLPGDIKVIVDWNKGTEEIYDLRKDPTELHDLRDTLPDATTKLLVAGAFIDWMRESSPRANGNQHTPGWTAALAGGRQSAPKPKAAPEAAPKSVPAPKSALESAPPKAAPKSALESAPPKVAPAPKP